MPKRLITGQEEKKGEERGVEGRRDTTGGMFFKGFGMKRVKRGTLLVVGGWGGGVSREERDVGWLRQSKVRSLCRWEL